MNRPSRRAEAWRRSCGHCWYCGTALCSGTFHLDHQTPKSQGGSNDANNLVAACSACNLRKHSLNLEQFRLFVAYNQVGQFSWPQILQMEQEGGPSYVAERPTVWFWGEGNTVCGF